MSGPTKIPCGAHSGQDWDDDPFFGLEEPAEILWPRLHSLGLSEKEIALRREGIGGSDANTILSGDEARIIDLWREKRGEQRPADLTSKLAVVLGNWTEEFNRQWFERQQETKIGARGIRLRCPKEGWRRSTLDGLTYDGSAIWEAKHTSAFATDDEVVDRYMPQLQHNMSVAGIKTAFLSVIFGNHRFEIFEIAADWLYQRELRHAELKFWNCVLSGERPVAYPIPAAPLPVGKKEISFEGHNSWAAAASDWLSTRAAAKLNASAALEIKSLIQSDVSKAFGHGIEVKRSKVGALTIRELAS